MYTCRGINIGRKTRRIHLYTVLLMVYFVMAPFEDLFTSERGTVAKYLGMMIIVVSMVEGWRLMKLRFTSDVIALIWLMFLGVLSCLWAIDVETAVSRNVAYLLVPGLFLFVNALTFSEREYEAIVKAAIVGGVAASIYVLTQSEFHGNSGRIILTVYGRM